MASDSKTIFESLYGPASTDQSKNAISTGNPEAGIFQADASEFAPIMEYVEPEIPPDVAHIVQNANPPLIPPHNIPILPIPTPQLSIPPVRYPQVTLSDEQIDSSSKRNIYDAFRWLAQWCLRQIKIEQYKDAHHPDYP